MRLERASQKQSSDTHKTPYDRVKRCRERKKYIKASERVNVDVFVQKNTAVSPTQPHPIFGRLVRSPPNKVRPGSFPGRVTPDFRKLESCRTMPLVGGFSRGSPVFPALSFRRRSILTSVTLICSLLRCAPQLRRVWRQDLLPDRQLAAGTVTRWQGAYPAAISLRHTLYLLPPGPGLCCYSHEPRETITESIKIAKLVMRRRYEVTNRRRLKCCETRPPSSPTLTRQRGESGANGRSGTVFEMKRLRRWEACSPGIMAPLDRICLRGRWSWMGDGRR
ncbi:hypothetical protein PR048_024046 [Dryococelus australis]|uniref:Uncharacterized protein n=1 Tax=Dryococelus australis TaxID=614101 RepID=A0ABQ9GVT5_9NEOP|nr:hypothetical protein PR048_024046 [Dryococelus australis]